MTEDGRQTTEKTTRAFNVACSVICRPSSVLRLLKKGAAGLGGGRPPRTRSGDGEGWGRDRVRVTFCFVQCDAVAVAGRWSPSEIHTLGLDWDCRFTKR